MSGKEGAVGKSIVETSLHRHRDLSVAAHQSNSLLGMVPYSTGPPPSHRQRGIFMAGPLINQHCLSIVRIDMEDDEMRD